MEAEGKLINQAPQAVTSTQHEIHIHGREEREGNSQEKETLRSQQTLVSTRFPIYEKMSPLNSVLSSSQIPLKTGAGDIRDFVTANKT
jgi:ABC-type phosphate/phosphonate transport system ATPase subunit